MTSEYNAEPVNGKIANVHKVLPTDKKPFVKRKGKKKNGKKEGKATRQKRDDFVIDDQKRIVCLRCMKPYATRKSFRRHYFLYVWSIFIEL